MEKKNYSDSDIGPGMLEGMSSDHARALQYYKDHQDELVAKYNGQTLIMKNEEILDVRNTFSEAYEFAVNEYGLGNFSLQEVSPGTGSYTVSISTPTSSIY